MQGSSDMVFPNTGVRVLSAFVQFFGVSVLAHCLSRRIAAEQLGSLAGLMQMSLARLLILTVLIDSWLFLFTGGMVIFGAGLESSYTVCSLGMLLCIIFYATSKALIYFFLVEKMHIVWAPIAGSRRMKSPVYLLSMGVLSGYTAIIILLFIGRISRIRDDGVCVIGLHHIASIPLIAYDLLTNILLTSLFLYPLWRSNSLNPRIKRIAARTTLAAIVALATSTVNMLILTLMHGEQLGWVCLGACGADVIVNALALFWVTTGPSDDVARSRSEGLPPVAGGLNKKMNVNVFKPTPPPPSSRKAMLEDGMSSGGVGESQRDRDNTKMTVAFHSSEIAEIERDRKTAPSPGPTHPISPTTPVTPPTPRHPLMSSTQRTRLSRHRGDGDGGSGDRHTGMSRLIGLFKNANAEKHELQITITRDVQTDFRRDDEGTNEEGDSNTKQHGRQSPYEDQNSAEYPMKTYDVV